VFLAGNALIVTRLLALSSLAIFGRFRPRKRPEPSEGFEPAVAVLVPAFNEEKVIVQTVRSVLNSKYSKLRVIVIDDGSTDDTFNTARAAFDSEPRVMVLTKSNGGKAKALNYGLQYVTEIIFLGIDADTCIDSNAVSLLVPHFMDNGIAAVAGNTRVGNQINLWTRWQSLEYTTSQNLERRALDVFGLVTVVPGAIGAWRMAAVREAGYYHPDTVAEDADLTMSLLELGYRVHYEDCAVAYTEAPSTLRTLIVQRFRWSFGILQSVWKHRAMFKRRGLLGWVALPNIVIFQFVLPIVSPFVDLIFLLGTLDYLYQPRVTWAQRFAGQVSNWLHGFSAGRFHRFSISDCIGARQRRPMAECPSVGIPLVAAFYLSATVFNVIANTVKRVLQGHTFEWGKLERTAAVVYPIDQKTIASPAYAETGTSRAA
jgi:cellulose synthase/poly-beta-1,6-N-acetylglucosamine synthase-like glycosyltransferase